MFYLHLSNRTENLVAHLAEVLKHDSGRDPFAREYFLIQSQGMERMLSQRLADVFVSWCNYEYMLPTRFFALLGEQLGVEAGPDEYERERVCWHLEKILRNVEGRCFQPLLRYMENDPKGIKRYQLAQQLAYVFDQYQIMRLSMVDGWEQGKLATENATEPYQMELWQQLVAAVGHSRHRGVFLRDLIGLLLEGAELGQMLPQRLSVFGLHSMPPLLLHALHALSKHCDVHFYLLSPCKQYWLDQTAPQVQLRKQIAAGMRAVVAEEQSVGHPLLQSLGQQGREFRQMLLEQVDFTREFEGFSDPLPADSPSLLQIVQSDLLEGQISEDKQGCMKDESLVVTSAHTPHREMMILKDRILHWLDADASLQLKDIVVMTPDIQAYSNLIPAVFHDIPHSIADRNPASRNTHIAAFLQFLKLCSGRFGWSEVFDLLAREEVYPRFDILEDDLEMIRHWVLSSGVRWGLSAESRKGMGLPEMAEGTWQSGIKRLLMGYSVDSEGTVDGVFPFHDIEGSMAEPLGGLSLFVEILEEAQRAFARPCTLQQWADSFLHYADRILVKDTEDALSQLFSLLEDMGSEYGQFHSEPLSFEVICSRMNNAVSETKSSSGFLRGQLTFCAMLPMRSIPFKKVCLLGVNDTVFPKNDTHPDFDLLGSDFRVGDRSRRSDDRYQFLEAILSARESLYISYVGQSIRTNEELPPSVLILELLELVRRYGVNDLTDVHPLHGFSHHYFSSASPLFSYNRSFARVAGSLQKDVSPPGSWWSGLVDSPLPKQVTVAQLCSFFRHPQKYFVQNVLGIRFDGSGAGLDESEPFVLDSLQNYLVEEELITGALRTRGGDSMRQLLQVSGQWPLGCPGELQFAEKEKEIEPFVAKLQEQEAEGRQPTAFVDIQIDSIRLQGSLSGIYTGGLFLFRYARMKPKDFLFAWIQHCLAAVCLEEPVATTFLAKDRILRFPAGCGGEDDLQPLLYSFVQGQQKPSPLLLDPAGAYVEQVLKNEGRGRADPLQKAIDSFDRSLTNKREAEWELLYRDESPESLFDEGFVELCEELLLPIWRKADEL